MEKKYYFCTVKTATKYKIFGGPRWDGDCSGPFLCSFFAKKHNGQSPKPLFPKERTQFSSYYTFTGKELDSETGYSYFGARYYDAELSGLFFSVDPMADKYPNISPYAYCAWNPIKLIDPNGDTIFNGYEEYKDIKIRLEEQNKSKEGTKPLTKERKNINRKIRELKQGNANYRKVQGALDAIRERNPEEYNRVDQLSYNGNAINIIVKLSSAFNSVNGAYGETEISHLCSDNNKVVGIKSPIEITLFQLAFAGGTNGLATLANEFGDAIFGVECPETQIEGYTRMEEGSLSYYDEASSRFSFAYEYYITDPTHHKKPNPHSFFNSQP